MRALDPGAQALGHYRQALTGTPEGVWLICVHVGTTAGQSAFVAHATSVESLGTQLGRQPNTRQQKTFKVYLPCV